jgi:hypothetical protein
MYFKLNGTVDLNKLNLSSGKDQEGDRLVRGTLKISLILDKETSKNTFGRQFSDLCFQQDKGNAWLYRSMKPSCDFDVHTVALDGLNRVQTAPTLENVEPFSGDEIRVNMRLPITMSDDAMLLRIIKRIGGPLPINIEPSQLELPLEDAA